jgi:hypothetical protein
VLLHALSLLKLVLAVVSVLLAAPVLVVNRRRRRRRLSSNARLPWLLLLPLHREHAELRQRMRAYVWIAPAELVFIAVMLQQL